jgi:hypothetical protein
MATIRRYGLLIHAQVEASAFLAVFRNGRLRKSGRGATVWFLPQGATSLVEVPAAERDHQLMISATTRDFQIVSVQGAATWRAADPLALADRVDFTINPKTGTYRADPLAQVEGLIDGLIKIGVERHVSTRDIGEVLADGVGPLLASIDREAKASPRLAAIGVELAGLRFSALAPSLIWPGRYASRPPNVCSRRRTKRSSHAAPPRSKRRLPSPRMRPRRKPSSRRSAPSSSPASAKMMWPGRGRQARRRK